MVFRQFGQHRELQLARFEVSLLLPWQNLGAFVLLADSFREVDFVRPSSVPHAIDFVSLPTPCTPGEHDRKLSFLSSFVYCAWCSLLIIVELLSAKLGILVEYSSLPTLNFHKVFTISRGKMQSLKHLKKNLGKQLFFVDE